MQKFTDSCYKNLPVSPYQYCLVDYTQAQVQQQQYHYDSNNNNYYMGNYLPYNSYNYMSYQQQQQQQNNHYLQNYEYSGAGGELFQLKRSLNLVQTTRKKDKDRYQ